jgi:hypothetical protein
MRSAEVADAPLPTARVWSRAWRLAIVAVILIGAFARVGVVRWAEPWDAHQPDEHILPLEALALWEGITPREVGWPASTSRLVISAVAAVQCVAEDGREMWRQRARPDRALEVVTRWIARRYVEHQSLYRLGRTISIVTGSLQLIALAWALSRWLGPVGTLVGTLAIALSPVTVAYSQYVLADIAGLLFGTIAIGLAAKPTPRRVIIMAALVGLAASSKFHFGLWVLTPLLCIWMGDPAVFPRKWRLTLATCATTALVVLVLVPWFVMNPLLALKEFAGVVLVKIGHGSRLGGASHNIAIIFGAFGALGWLGALAGATLSSASDQRRFAPVMIPLVPATTALVLSAIVFDRYSIVLFPGAAIITGLGWDEWLRHPRLVVRRTAAVVLAAVLIVTTTSLVRSQRVVGEADVDVLVRNWIVANVSPGSRLAVHDEMNAYLPRVADQLRDCAEHVTTVAAYEEKWLVEGVRTSAGDQRPMESMVLNDERFNAYWCRRELDVANPNGFRIVTYHDEPRFDAVLERDAVNDFRTGGHLPAGVADVLVMNRPIEVGSPPVQTFETARGKRVIYRR